MAFSSNLDQVVQQINALVHTLDFDHSVGNMSLGKRMAEKTAEMIAARSIQLQKGADQQWDENKEPYKTWKATKYGVHDLAGVRTGQMLSQESLRGDTTVSATEVEMVYGTDTSPTRSATGFITAADRKITDRKKAEYFTDGGPNQAARPFYELDEDIANEIFAVVDEALDKIFGV